MSKYSYDLFATRNDLIKLLQAIEGKRSINYVKYDLFDSKSVQRFKSACDIEDLGIAKMGDQNHEQMFLLIDSGADVDVREVPQRRGGIKYAVDQLVNPKTIAFTAGGEYQDNAIIASKFDTASEEPDSQELLNLISGEIRHQFKKIKAYYVGRNAEHALDAGARLTASIHSPTDYDLRK